MVYNQTGDWRIEDNGDGTLGIFDTVSGNGITLDDSGGISIADDFDLGTFDLLAEGNITIWDNTANEIPDSALGSIDNATLSNSSLTVSAGDGLKSGGLVSLGGTTTLNIEPADFAGFGVEDDGADNIRVDEDSSFAWTDQHTFNGGVTMGSAIDLQDAYQIINAPSPVNPGDLARKSYVDNSIEGATDIKESVVASPTINIDLTSASDPNPVDGVNLTDGQRVLLKSQTDKTENGIYVAATAADPTTWVRSSDADEDDEVNSGMFTFVEEGSANGNSSFIVTTSDPITLGVTEITVSQFSSAGEISAGDGLTKAGQTLNINVSDFAGTFLSDDGANNLEVDIGRGLEDDGSNNIRVDEDYDFTFTAEVDFNGGASFGSTLNMVGNDINNVTNLEMDGNIVGIGTDYDISEVDNILGPANGSTSLTLETQGDGSHDITLRDGFNSQDIAVFNEGGNVEIPNGDLDIISGNILFGDENGSKTISGPTGSRDLQIDAGRQVRIIVDKGNSGNSFWDFDIQNGANDRLFTVRQDGNVEIPSGTLDVTKTTSPSGVNTAVDIGSNSTGISALSSASGFRAGTFDNTNSNLRVELAGGNAFTYEGMRVSNISSGDTYFGVDSSGNVEIPTNDARLQIGDSGQSYIEQSGTITRVLGQNGFRIGSFHGSVVDAIDVSQGSAIIGVDNTGANPALRVWDDAQNEILVANNDNSVEIPNGDLQVTGSGNVGLENNQAYQIKNVGGTYINALDSSSNTTILRTLAGGSDTRIDLGNNTSGWYDGEGTERVRVYGGGVGDGETTLFTSGSGSSYVSLRDDANSQNILVANEGGNVEIPNGDLDVGKDVDTTQSVNVFTGGANTGNKAQFGAFESDNDSYGFYFGYDDTGNTGFIDSQDANEIPERKRILEFGRSGPITANENIELQDGSAGSPALSFNSDTDSGLYSDGANGLALSTNGITRLNIFSGGSFNFNNGTVTGVQNLRLSNDGTASFPPITWENDVDTGIYRLGADIIGLTANGVESAEFSDNFINLNSDTSIEGNNLLEVGGATDASSGAIRLANNSNILWRNSTNDGNIGIVGSASDDIEVLGNAGTDFVINNGDLNLNGNEIVEAGAIRSSDRSGDGNVSSVSFDANDKVNITAGGSAVLSADENQDVSILNGNLSMESNRVTNLSAPVDNNDSARKAYVDGVAQGLNLKDSAVASPTVNIDLASATDPNPIDGVTLSNGDRVLLKEQTDGTENGIYVASTATDPTTWTRSADADEDSEVTSGMFTFVEEGTQNGNTSYIVTTDDPITLGVTSIVFAQFASAGEITAGDGLSKTGTTLDVNFGTGVELNSDNVRLDEDYSATWTTQQTFNSGLSSAGNIDLNQNSLLDVDDVFGREGDTLNFLANGGDGGLIYQDVDTTTVIRLQRGGDVDIPNGNLSIGQTPAVNGTVRLGNGSDISARNQADTGDLTLISPTSSDDVVVGDLANVDQIKLEGTTGMNVDVSGTIAFNQSDLQGLGTINDETVTIGNGVDTIPQVELDSGASGFPRFEFLENGSRRARLEYVIDTGRLRLIPEVAGDMTLDVDGEQVEGADEIRGGPSNNTIIEFGGTENLADSGKAQLSNDQSALGYAMIQDSTNQETAMVFLGGTGNSVEIIHDSGATTNFTTTEDNDGTTNIYWDAGNAQYEINNETGASATYSLQIMKA